MINKEKRDILIFPKFDNLDLIESVRKKYDPLYSLVDPHITVVFPFSDVISNDKLSTKISNLLKDFEPFEVVFKGISISKDNYIFLNQVIGNDKIIKLHDLIYSNILPTHLNTKIEYIPHITLGRLNDSKALKESTAFNIYSFNENFPYEFKTIINKISIEQIGENEESIIVSEINFI